MCIHWHSSKADLYYHRHSCDSGAGPSFWEVARFQESWRYFCAHLLIVIWAKSCVNSSQISLEKVGRPRKSTWVISSPVPVVTCTYWYSTLACREGSRNRYNAWKSSTYYLVFGMMLDGALGAFSLAPAQRVVWWSQSRSSHSRQRIRLLQTASELFFSLWFYFPKVCGKEHELVMVVAYTISFACDKQEGSYGLFSSKVWLK